MEALVDESVKFLIGAGGAALLAVISPLFRTSRRLREELRHDVELVDRLPRGPRAELRDEIRRRSHQLVAMTRHPPVTRADVLAIGMWLLVCAFAVASIVNVPEDTDPAEVASVVTVLASTGLGVYGSYIQTYRAWSTRAEARLRYIDSHIGRDEAETTARMVRVGDYALMFLIQPILGCLIVAIALWMYTVAPSWVPVAVVFAACLGLYPALMFRVVKVTAPLVTTTQEILGEKSLFPLPGARATSATTPSATLRPVLPRPSNMRRRRPGDAGGEVSRSQLGRLRTDLGSRRSS